MNLCYRYYLLIIFYFFFSPIYFFTSLDFGSKTLEVECFITRNFLSKYGNIQANFRIETFRIPNIWYNIKIEKYTILHYFFIVFASSRNRDAIAQHFMNKIYSIIYLSRLRLASVDRSAVSLFGFVRRKKKCRLFYYDLRSRFDTVIYCRFRTCSIALMSFEMTKRRWPFDTEMCDVEKNTIVSQMNFGHFNGFIFRCFIHFLRFSSATLIFRN